MSADLSMYTRLVCEMCETTTSMKNVKPIPVNDSNCHDVSQGEETTPIRMYGDDDTFKKLQTEFISYITQPIMSPCVRIAWERNGGVQSCDHYSRRSSRNETAVDFERTCSFSKNIHSSKHFECNRYCGCSRTEPEKYCDNRVTQQGIRASLEVFWTGKERRWGVRTLQRIRKGEFVCNYVGEIIPMGCKCEYDCDNDNCVHLTSCSKCRSEGRTRMRDNQAYVFELKSRNSGKIKRNATSSCKYAIDGRRYRNIGPFLNHACSGFNIEPRFMYAEHHDTDLPTISFFAKRNIKANEEILINYGNKLPGCLCVSCKAKK